MFNRKTIPTITGLLLLLSSCGTQSGKYDLVGSWELKCTAPERNFEFLFTSIYRSDGSYQTQSSILNSHDLIIAGSYKVNQEQLEEIVTHTSETFRSSVLPRTVISNLNWIDDDSLTIHKANNGICAATRKK